MCKDNITNEQMARLQDHFQLCNTIDCPACKLYGEGVKKFAEAWDALKKGFLVVKIVTPVDCDYCTAASKGCGYQEDVRKSADGNCPMRRAMGEPDPKKIGLYEVKK